MGTVTLAALPQSKMATSPRFPRPLIHPNPGICAGNIDNYVLSRARAGDINLYSAFTLAHEATRIGRDFYLLPAWKRTLAISGLLRIYMDALTARALGCSHEASQAEEWFLHDRALLDKHRPHFLVARLNQGAALFADRSFHQELADLRANYDDLSDDDGPFPNEVFLENAAPELELLKPGSQSAFADRTLDDETSEVYAEICIAT